MTKLKEEKAKSIGYKLTDEQYIKAIEGSAGIVMDIIKRIKEEYGVSLSRQGFHEKLKNNPDVKEAYDTERENIHDLGESKFVKAIKREESWAIRDWLKYGGKYRGYSTHSIQEVEDKREDTAKLNEALNLLKDEISEEDKQGNSENS